MRAATKGIICFIGPNSGIAERIRGRNGNDLNLKWIFCAKRRGVFIVFRIIRLFLSAEYTLYDIEMSITVGLGHQHHFNHRVATVDSHCTII